MDTLNLVFAYFGPETVMPVTSIIATCAALVVMFGRNTLRWALVWVRLLTYKGRRVAGAARPHIGIGRAGVRRSPVAHANRAAE